MKEQGLDVLALVEYHGPMKPMKTIHAPEQFDSEFVASLTHHQATRVQTFLICDTIKASSGLFDQMWLRGTEQEARARLAMVRAHGQQHLGWIDAL